MPSKTRVQRLLAMFGLPLLCLTLLGLTTSHVEAAPVQGITVSPFLQTVDISPGDSTKSFTLKLTNNTATATQLNLSPQDFGSLDSSGRILLDSNSNYSQKYGLISWLSLDVNSVALDPGQSKAVQVTIENRSSLQPGGHYGAVVATVASENPAASNDVQISQQVTSLILATKHGGERYDLSLKDVVPNGNWLHLPDTVRLRFQNPGNVHVIPRGTINLKNAAGTVVASGVINDDSNYILPETYRQIYVSLKPVNTGIEIPGPYAISVDYRYDGLATTRNKTIGLRFVGLKIYLVVIFLTMLVVTVLIKLRSRRKKAATKLSQKL